MAVADVLLPAQPAPDDDRHGEICGRRVSRADQLKHIGSSTAFGADSKVEALVEDAVKKCKGSGLQ